MGQDDRCGICGKDYMRCPHALKEHYGTKEVALCGVKNPILFDEETDTDPDVLCRRCQARKK